MSVGLNRTKPRFSPEQPRYAAVVHGLQAAVWPRQPRLFFSLNLLRPRWPIAPKLERAGLAGRSARSYTLLMLLLFLLFRGASCAYYSLLLIGY